MIPSHGVGAPERAGLSHIEVTGTVAAVCTLRRTARPDWLRRRPIWEGLSANKPAPLSVLLRSVHQPESDRVWTRYRALAPLSPRMERGVRRSREARIRTNSNFRRCGACLTGCYIYPSDSPSRLAPLNCHVIVKSRSASCQVSVKLLGERESGGCPSGKFPGIRARGAETEHVSERLPSLVREIESAVVSAPDGRERG